MAALCLGAVFRCWLDLTRYVSLSSITASIAFPVIIVFIFNAHELSYRIFAIAKAVLVVLTHHKNIGRLIHGNESKVPFFKKKRFRDWL